MEPFTLLLMAVIYLTRGACTDASHTPTCLADCETNTMYARMSCEGHMLQCVPDPCCRTDTRHLNMAHNQLTRLRAHAFQSFPRLRILDLRQNVIGNIAPGAFSNLNHLQLLDVRGNKLRHLYAGLFNGVGAGIQKLYLAENEIESVAPGTFSGMGNLISLKLSHNRITSLQRNMFLPLQSLQRLYLCGNQLRGVHSEAFRGLVQLGKLSLSENPLVTLPNILPYLPSIAHIRLHNTPLNCDCRLEFLRLWLRQNMFEAHESFAMCSVPGSLEDTPLYQVQDPLQCSSSRDGNIPISREVNDLYNTPDMEDGQASALTEAHSESESEYSEFYASSLSELSHGPISQPSVSSTEGGISGGGRGIEGMGRPETSVSSGLPRTHAPIEPLTPRATLSPVVTTTKAPMIHDGRNTTNVISHFTPPTLTQSSQKDILTTRAPDSPRSNVTDDGSASVNGSFNELPRPPPRTGNRNHPNWNEGENQMNPDDSVMTTTSFEVTDPYKSPATAEEPRGPPQFWGMKGSSVKIVCPVHIHNINESKIKWLTPHGKLIMMNVSRFILSRRGSLIIRNLQESDHGTYRCIVRKALNSVKMLPAKLALACPCHQEPQKKPSFEPSTNTSSGDPFGPDTPEHPFDEPLHPHEAEVRCSPVPMVVAIVTTFQATVALCVIIFCLCFSKNLNYSLKDRTCFGVPEPIAVVRTRNKLEERPSDFGQSGGRAPASSSIISSGGSDFYEALTDHGFSPRQASSVRSYDAYYESYPQSLQSDYVNYRKQKSYMYMVGYTDSGTGRRAIGYRSSTGSQCASIKEITNENIYVSKD